MAISELLTLLTSPPDRYISVSDAIPVRGFRENFFYTPGFEAAQDAAIMTWGAGETGSTAGLSSDDVSTDFKFGGSSTQSARYMAAGDNASTGQYYALAAGGSGGFVPIVGVSYTFSGYLFVPMGSPITAIGVGIRDYFTYEYISNSQAELMVDVTPGKWTRFTVSAVGGSNHAGGGRSFSWIFTVADPSGTYTTASWYLDNTMVEMGSSERPYFDGATPNSSWSDGANTSTSKQTLANIGITYIPINVETTEVDEVVTVSFSSSSNLTINVSDTSTPGETRTITNTQLGNISVSDTSTPGEVVAVSTQLGNISVSDTSTPGETRTITNTQLGNISVSDTSTPGEVRTVSTQLGNISKTDSITTTEYVRRKNPSPSTPSFGVNYKSLTNADADIAYFRTQGITTVRIDIPVYDTWVGGDWVLFLDLANKFYEAGFYVIYGVSGDISATYTWAQFSSDAQAAAAEAEGKCSEFTVGNEMDSSNDDGYISDATLRSNLRSLATTVKGIFSGVVSYATIAGTSGDSFGSYQWALEGKGGYDKIGLNIYGQADNPYTTFISSYTDYIPYFFKTFGSDAYISEFNLDGGDPANFAGIPNDTKLYLMKWMDAYLRNWGITARTLYTWRGFKDTNNDYAVKLIDNTLLSMFDVFSISDLSNPTYLFRSDGNTQNVYITPYDQTALQVGAVSDFSIGMKVLLTKKTVSGNDDNHTIANCDFDWGGNKGHLFQIGSSDGHLEVYSGNTSYSSSTGVFEYDTWQYVAFTLTGTTLKGYVNGTNVWTDTITRKATGGTTDSKIGAESPGFREFTGYAKDFWSVKSLLNGTQITDITTGSYPTLDLHYPINEGISYAAIDTSGNNNIGLYNEPDWMPAPMVSDSISIGESVTITYGTDRSISTSDTSTPGETRTVTNTQLGNISVSDTSTPGETRTITNTQLGNISVSDTSTPGEVRTVSTQLGNISVSDTSTPGEVMTISVQLGNISVSDTSTPGEVVTVNTQLGNISVSDTSTPGETRTITNTQLGNISVSDTSTPGESLTVSTQLGDITISVSDTSTPGEAVTITNTQLGNISVSDVVKPADDKFIADSYPEANYSSETLISGWSSYAQGMGQSFTAIGGNVASAKFYLYKALSPTGNAVAKIYAHSGTFGISSLPTGAALATSDNFDVSTLGSGTGNIALVEFVFSGANKIELTQGTKYFVTVEYSGGDGTNYVGCGIDVTSPGHSGNGAFYRSATWQVSANDRIFYVYETPGSYPTVTITNQLGNISVSDTSTPGETRTVTNTQLGNISSTETITIGDTIQDYEDRIIIGETVTVIVGQPGYSISVSDTSTPGEVRTVSAQLGNISVSDTSTPGETRTITNTQLGNISVSDTSTPGETRTITNTQLGNISSTETITIGDTIPDDEDRIIIGEVVTITISPAPRSISVSDTSTIGEIITITSLPPYLISVSDATVIFEDLGQSYLPNGNFEYAPAFVAAQTTSGRWIDGTATGSASVQPYSVHASFGGAAGDKNAQFDSANPYTGNNSLKLHTNSGAYGELRTSATGYFGTYGIRLKPNTSYQYSFWMKSENVSGSAGGQSIQLLFSNAAGTQSLIASPGGGSVSEFNATGSITTNKVWTNYTGTFITGSTTVWYHPEFRVYGHNGAATLTGDFWFDDCSVTPVIPDAGNVVISSNVNISESQNISEAITAAPGDLSISLSESLVTAEQITGVFIADRQIQITDSESIGEGVTASTTLANILVSDTLGITEVVNVNKILNVAVSDAIVTTEGIIISTIRYSPGRRHHGEVSPELITYGTAGHKLNRF